MFTPHLLNSTSHSTHSLSTPPNESMLLVLLLLVSSVFIFFLSLARAGYVRAPILII